VSELPRSRKWEVVRARVFVRLARMSRQSPDKGGDAIIAALVERTGEVLSPTDFVWHVDDGVVSIRGVGRMLGTGVTIVVARSFRKYLPKRSQVRSTALAYMDDVAALASKAQGGPWPAPHARCRVRVKRRAVTISWTLGWSRKRLVQLRTIELSEL
jgi:hypothetical protein